MNSFLAHGFFDTEGLSSILWRNRSLQEFFTACWLAQYCADADVTHLKDWIYTPDDPASEEYYWVWRYAAEMPTEACDPEAWVRSMAPLYAPGDGTWKTKRSNEMLYRSWETMESYAKCPEEATAMEAAKKARSGFLGEFEGIVLAGQRGEKTRAAAEEFRNSLIEVPVGEFQMGSPEEKQGRMPDDQLRDWGDWLRRGHNDPEQHVKDRLSQYVWPDDKQGAALREKRKKWLLEVHRDGDLDRIARELYPSDETPEQRRQSVEAFRLSHSPTINAWYRLYEPGHGLRPSSFQDQYARISGAPDTPVVYIGWYDAWAFCVWAHWEGRSCRLPREHEWEYAAKAATPWDWGYWWGDKFDATKCTAGRRVDHTTPPHRRHVNPWGFQDILGNVLEWCHDWYRPRYSRTATDPMFARVLRGGSYLDDPRDSRSGARTAFPPTMRLNYAGFRVARVLPHLGYRISVRPENINFDDLD
jgi:formylglycine-generating enzyme required for sulfatase activity